MKTLFFSSFFLLFAFLAHSQTTTYSSWAFTGIVNGFDGGMTQDVYIVSEPKIERLDPTVGGELWFDLAPKSQPSCVQTFRVGWIFDTPVANLREGQTIRIQAFNMPTGDRGTGLKECYQQARQKSFDAGLLTIHFRGGAPNHIHKRKDFAKYWGAKSPYLFSLTPAEGLQVLPVSPGYGAPVGSASGELFVRDGMTRTGEADAPFGSFCIEISKPGVFRYVVTYLYDGQKTTLQPLPVKASPKISLEAPVVEHNVMDNGVNGMRFSLPGSIQNAEGKSLQVVVRFSNELNFDLQAAPDETYYRDNAGYLAISNHPILIPGDEYSFQDFILTMPYSSLNLPSTGGQVQNFFVYAEIFLDGKSAGFSPKAKVSVRW